MISGHGNSKSSRASHPSKLASLGEWKMDHTLGEDEVGVKQWLANSQTLFICYERLIHSTGTLVCLSAQIPQCTKQTGKPTALNIVEKRTETVKRSLQCSVRSSKMQLTGAVGPQQLPSANLRWGKANEGAGFCS